MILICLIGILLGAGILAWLTARWSAQLPRWIALIAIGVDLVLAARIWADRASSATEVWLDEVDWNWVPSFGIHFHLAVDGLSLLMLLLTFFLGIMAVLASWTEIREQVGFFHFNLMWVLAGIVGVFLAVDLFLFYFAWELMLVPMYFLIVIWGHERRVYAAVKFFLFTQLSGLLMLIAILALYFIHHQTTGVYTFVQALRAAARTFPRTAWLVLSRPRIVTGKPECAMARKLVLHPPRIRSAARPIPFAK